MIKLVKLGTIKLKRFRYDSIFKLRDIINSNNPEIRQIDIDDHLNFDKQYYLSEIKKLVNIDHHYEEELLFFRSVDSHNDGWSRFNRRSPYFVHVCLRGSGIVVAGKKRLKISKGDVFILNPNCYHSYIHEGGKFCATFCTTVTLARRTV